MKEQYSYDHWIDDNQKYLSIAFKIILQRIQQKSEDELTKSNDTVDLGNLEKEASSLMNKMQHPPAIEVLTEIFGLTIFEKNILLLCAGVELDTTIASVVSKTKNQEDILPSFAFAFSVFNESYWNAISPNAALRYWRMISLGKHSVVMQAPIKIDENILHYLTGTGYLNEKLLEFVEPVSAIGKPDQKTQEKLNLIIGNKLKDQSKLFPVIVLMGRDKHDKQDAAVYISLILGFAISGISSDSLPTNSGDVLELTRLWNREARLNRHLLFLNCDETDLQNRTQVIAVQHFIEKIDAPLIISSEEWIPEMAKPKVIIEIAKPSGEEQLKIWETELERREVNVNGMLESIVSQFNLSNNTIKQAAAELAEGLSESKKDRSIDPAGMLWKICSQHTKPVLGGLAQRIEPVAHWDDLVLPEQQKSILKELIVRFRNRDTVYNKWGFASKGLRGLGISALFAGESGTGKTMASEVLANELKLDLYRIDLSKVVNKYIGETEKNLKKIFDAAEDGGAILLFDEADALFGKRSNVKDSHDRYSNIEVSYLLQRMEAYRGLAILTTNMKSAIDSAFARRFSVVVNFPFPDFAQRNEIWRKVFPKATPVENPDWDKLSRFTIAGGNIKNIALNAAFLAANERTSVQMPHILQAAKTEYVKMEIPFSNEFKLV